jgi:hypothetical protein
LIVYGNPQAFRGGSFGDGISSEDRTKKLMNSLRFYNVTPEEWSMIHGVVSRNREATISLVIVNESRQTKLITAVIDTGYTSFLSLPSEIITE